MEAEGVDGGNGKLADPWLWTTGVNTSGAAAKVMKFENHPETISETASVLESRQRLLYTTPSGWRRCKNSLFRHYQQNNIPQCAKTPCLEALTNSDALQNSVHLCIHLCGAPTKNSKPGSLRKSGLLGVGSLCVAPTVRLHPVSITRFPLRRFSPGAGLLRNPFVHR